MAIPFDGLTYLTRRAGNIFRMRYYTETIGSVWDDNRTLAQSGNDFYTSGVILSIDGSKGSEDQILMEQGRIKYDDSKIYLSGTIPTTSGVRIFTIAISGNDIVYQNVMPGNRVPQYFGQNVYQKIYARVVTTGSLL